MLYNDFQGLKLSRLGFGTMRLPLNEDKSIDQEQVERMTDYAIAHGVNYFDTAAPYHAGYSELSIGKALSKHPRDSYYLADKFPGHQIASHYDPKGLFEEQLKKCGVEYFDFYLLHNVCENSIPTYEDPRWQIMETFIQLRNEGKIRHLGMSSHAQPETLEAFLNRYGKDMEFVQIQCNYLDWSLQNAEKKVEILNRFGIPVWVMEPVHGGRLATLNEADTAELRARRPEDSTAAWGFRWLQGIPGVTMILSGMSNMEQMMDNVKTFSEEKPLSAEETALLYRIADGMKDALPCTACRYCCDGCPKGLNIPNLIGAYNDAKFGSGFTVPMYLDTLPEEKKPAACIGCGACARICPQKIDIPKAMKNFAALIKTLPSWADICREREEAARRLREG